MKYSIIFCAITGALAVNTNIVARDAATVTNILSDVKKDLEALDSTVKSYSGDKAPLLQASNDLITTLKDGKTKVEGSEMLDLNGAVTLTTPVQDLTKSGEALTTDLKAFRPTIEEEGQCVLVRTQVNNVNDASQELIKAVIDKVPTEAQQIASQLVAGLTKILQDSVDQFSEENCKDSASGGSGSSSAAPSGSSSAAAGSSSAAAGSSSAAATSAASTSAAASSSAAHTTAHTTASAGASSSSAPSPSTPVVAGAAAVAPFGAAALAVAALLL